VPLPTRQRVGPLPAAIPEQPPHTRRLALWLGSLGTSLCADQVFFLALTWAAIQVGTPGQVGVVVAAASLPRLVLLLLGGTLADRVNPRVLAAVSDAGRAVAVAAAVAVVLTVDLRIWQLVVVAVAVGALDGLFMPAIGALPASIAPPHLLGRVGALRAVAQRVALLLAGPISGALIAWAGIAAGLATAAALFLVSVTLLLLLPTRAAAPGAAGHPVGTPAPGPAPTSFAADLAAGLRVVRRDAVLPWLLLLIAALNLGFAGPVTAGLPLLAAEQHWGASGAGFLLGAFGIGAAATGLTLIFVRGLPRNGVVLLVAFAVQGLAIGAFAFAPGLLGALVDALLLGLGSGVVSSIVYGMLHTATPPAALGRVMALVSIALEATFPVSNYLTGVVVQVRGSDLAFLVGGGLLVVAAVAAATRPAIRDFRRL